MGKKQITLADLAQELGISTATVSRALKDYPDISADTKQRVIALAQKWNYRPNTMAAGLRKRESKVIGVIIPSIVNHFFSSVIKGIMEIAYDQDYRVMICQSDESHEKEVTDAYALLSSRVDGMLVSLAHETKTFDHFDAFLESGTPVVFFDKIPPEEVNRNFSTVVVDDNGGAYGAVSHLIQQGYTSIAHLRGPMLASTSRERFNGYQRALEEAGLTVDPNLIFSCESMDFEEGMQHAEALLASGVACDAVFCVTDTVAMGVATALRRRGKRIPEDIAVVGFSNWQISEILEPPLTSVAQPSLEMGQKATHLLLQEIQATKNEQTFTHQKVLLPTQLIVRKSSSPSLAS